MKNGHSSRDQLAIRIPQRLCRPDIIIAGPATQIWRYSPGALAVEAMPFGRVFRVCAVSFKVAQQPCDWLSHRTRNLREH